jgi:hypothetical protein
MSQVRLDRRIQGALIFCLSMSFILSLGMSVTYLPTTPQLDSWIPLDYWVLLGIVIVLWAASLYCKASNRTVLLSVLVADIIMFITLQASEMSARSGDTYGFFWASQFVGQPQSIIQGVQNLPGISYLLNWPGYFYFVASLRSVTGLNQIVISKILAWFFILLIPILAYSAGKGIFKDARKATVYASATLPFVAWLAVDTSPQVMGVIFLMLFVAVWQERNSVSVSLEVLLITAVVTFTHGFTALEILVLLFTATLVISLSRIVESTRRVTKFGKALRSASKVFNESSQRYLIFPVIVLAFWAIHSSFVGSNLLQSLETLLGLGLTPATYQFGYLTPYRLPSIISAAVFYAFLLILLFYALITATRQRDMHFFTVGSLCLLLVALTYFFPYTYADLATRLIQTLFPFLAWLIVIPISSHAVETKKVGIILICALAISGTVYFYSHESLLVYPTSETNGSQFYVNHALESTSLGYFSVAPLPWEFTNAPTVASSYYQISYNLPSPAGLLSKSNIIIDSLMVRNSLLYYSGSDSLNSYVTSHAFASVYDSGSYSIYYRPG